LHNNNKSQNEDAFDSDWETPKESQTNKAAAAHEGGHEFKQDRSQPPQSTPLALSSR
jgi:hypothetical protein